MAQIPFERYVFFLVFVAALIFLFLFVHLRPLHEAEIHELAAKRRGKRVRRYFSYDRLSMSINMDFKRTMESAGRFYRITDSLSNFPGRAAALLKYKKHEWIIVAFERNQVIGLLWVNKGPDNTQVPLYLPAERILSVARNEGYTAVLMFHNHPNPDPARIDALRPSDQDLEFAKTQSDYLNSGGINVAQFVCERGRYLEYSFSPADHFLPRQQFSMAIQLKNGRSRITNLLLHLERLFG